MPDAVLAQIIHYVTRWLDEVSKSELQHTDVFLRVIRRVMHLPLDAETGMTSNGEPINQPVTEAINHPIGHITQSLLNIWVRSGLSDGDGLPEWMGQLFTELCDSQVERYRHGRVLLASRLIALFRVDEAWTRLICFLISIGQLILSKLGWLGRGFVVAASVPATSVGL